MNVDTYRFAVAVLTAVAVVYLAILPDTRAIIDARTEDPADDERPLGSAE